MNAHTVSDQMIDDIFTAAVDPGYGGALYWADVRRIKQPETISFRDFADSDGNTYVGEYLINGGWYAIGERGDWNEVGDWHPLDKVAMMRGIQKAAGYYTDLFIPSLARAL